VRQDSCKKTNFKSQRSLSSISHAKTPEPEYHQKELFSEIWNKNAQSSHNLIPQTQICLRNSENTLKNTAFPDIINESFGKVVQPPNNLKKEVKYTVEFLGKNSYKDESEESEEEESEEEESEIEKYSRFWKGFSVDQTSDEDDVVDSVINKISSFSASNKATNQRYKQDFTMSEFEFTNENNIFTKGTELFWPISSRDSTIDNKDNESWGSQQQSGFNLPLQIHKKGNVVLVTFINGYCL